jgi:hypothetical protein
LFIGAEIEYSGAVYTRVGISNFAVLKDGYTELIEELGELPVVTLTRFDIIPV